MTTATRTLVRRRIGDMLKSQTENFIGDDTGKVQLSFNNPTLYNVYIDGAVVPTTDYTIEKDTGLIVFEAGTLAPDQKVIISYGYTAFSDTELDELIAERGVNGSCVEAIRWLLADSARMHDYSRGATSESLSQIFKNLKDLLLEFEKMGGLGDPNNTGEGAPAQVQVRKRIHDYYRGTKSVPFDLSRDDSLSN